MVCILRTVATGELAMREVYCVVLIAKAVSEISKKNDFCNKMKKNCIFFKNIWSCVRATPSHFTTQLYLRTPPWSALCLTNSPEATVAKCSPYASFSAQKMLKNTKNAFFLHFFSKKFAYVHFLLYLCTRFRKGSMTYGHGAIV